MSFKEINILVSNISETSELFPFCLAFFLVKKPPYNLLGWFFFISAPIKILSMVTAMYVMNNMVLFHVLAVVEVVLLYLFYDRIIFNRPPNWYLVALLILVNLLNSLFNENIFQFNSIGWSINIIILLSLGLKYFHKIYQGLETTQFERSPLFIINTGLLVYFTGSLFTYILGSKILSKDSQDFFNNAWVIQSFSNISKNLIVGYGLWLAKFR
ncbi:MAG TPA: hypothetical protein VKQ08_07440 [Cyclobacteriaceae bacterium]|nr:hypothetical protein [Cyclobacteriaceae bacterium]